MIMMYLISLTDNIPLFFHFPDKLTLKESSPLIFISQYFTQSTITLFIHVILSEPKG